MSNTISHGLNAGQTAQTPHAALPLQSPNNSLNTTQLVTTSFLSTACVAQAFMSDPVIAVPASSQTWPHFSFTCV